MTSLRSRILHRTLQRVTGAIALNLTVQEQRTRMDELARRGIRLPKGVTVCSDQAGGVHSEWVEPSRTDTQRLFSICMVAGTASAPSIPTAVWPPSLPWQVKRASCTGLPSRPGISFPGSVGGCPGCLSLAAQAGHSIKTNRHGWRFSRRWAGGRGSHQLEGCRRNPPRLTLPPIPVDRPDFSGESMHTRRQVDPIFGRDGGPQYAPAYVDTQSGESAHLTRFSLTCMACPQP